MSAATKIAALAAAAVLLSGCDLGQKVWQQTGYRGTGTAQIADKSLLQNIAAIPPPPYPLDASMLTGEKANVTYKNVKVLGNLTTEEFNHAMASITQWVAPGEAETQGCNYCHNPENMASDEKYTKVVARRMIQMTLNINSNWQSHVQKTGVTCWTCHAGNNVPLNKWAASDDGYDSSMVLRGNKHGQNTPDRNVGYASLPSDPFAAYLAGNTNNIRVASSSAYPTPGHLVSIKDAERSYGLMMHISKSLGVNCTYCHNSQSFKSWDLSRAQRGTAYYGIRMVRDVNHGYITPLTGVFPAVRKGALGDPYKVNCLTCHQGLAKPLNGVSMLPDYPYLRGPGPAAGGMTTIAATTDTTPTPTDANAVTQALAQPAGMTDKSGK